MASQSRYQRTSLYNGRSSPPIVGNVHGTPGDTYAVLMNLGEVLGRLMSTGRSVKLKGVGSFYYTCRSEGTGADTPEEVSPAQITAVQIRFIPEYFRGQRGQVTERTLLSPYIEWVDADDGGREAR